MKGVPVAINRALLFVVSVIAAFYAAVTMSATPDPQLFRAQLTPLQLKAKLATFALLTTDTEGQGGLCTGFLIEESGETLMITAGHCCAGNKAIGAVRLDTIYPVEIGSFSKTKAHDACVLKPTKTMAAMPTKFTLAPDDTVLYLGKQLAAFGYVDGVGIVQVDLLASGTVEADIEGLKLKVIAADGSVRPGMSGGALTDGTGAVVGLVTATGAANQKSYHTRVSDIRKAIKDCRQVTKVCKAP